MSWYRRRGYVSASDKRAKAARKLAAMRKAGKNPQPVIIEGRTIARTFWGKAWCDHLKTFSDYASRLPRGRTYARNGSILDLRVERGRVRATVQGSSTYEVEVTVPLLPVEAWRQIQAASAGEIGSLVELLEGKLSGRVMDLVTSPQGGLFPTAAEIQMRCSCPDWAVMCKHVGGALYGVGARLDAEPSLLFLLRGVDPSELLMSAFDRGGRVPAAKGKVLDSDALAGIFGVDIDFDFEVPKQASLTERLVDGLVEKDGQRVPELAKALKEREATIEVELKELAALGMVRWQGYGQARRWFVA